jgi:heat shock protein HslJ
MRSVWQVKDAHTLRMLDEQGDSIASELNDELTSTYSLPPVLPGLLPQFGAPRANTRWVPLRIGKHAVTVPASQHEPWIVLEPKPRNVAGSGGCNRFTGSYDVGVTTLWFRSLTVRRMMCSNVRSETAFLKALNQTCGYRVDGRRLELLDAHDGVLAELEERNLWDGFSSAGRLPHRVRTVRELSANTGRLRSPSVDGARRKLSNRITECPIASNGRALWSAFNFQFAWSSGTVAGRSAAST